MCALTFFFLRWPQNIALLSDPLFSRTAWMANAPAINQKTKIRPAIEARSELDWLNQSILHRKTREDKQVTNLHSNKLSNLPGS